MRNCRLKFSMKKKKYYAYAFNGSKGIVENWKKCEQIVSGVPGAKYKGFETFDEAARWLDAGADYGVKHIAGNAGIYFDAGTGAGTGVEINVTDAKGSGLLYLVLPEDSLDESGHYKVKRNATNNFGELLACKYALEIAQKIGTRKIFGDSALILDYWSKGYVKQDKNEETIALTEEVKRLRENFEKNGGQLFKISGAANPADLGFHKN